MVVQRIIQAAFFRFLSLTQLTMWALCKYNTTQI